MVLPDPAWFYSALAQSSSAIVALVGALQISRLSEERQTLSERRRPVETEVVNVGRSYASRRIWWPQLRSFWEGEVEADRRAEREGATERFTRMIRSWTDTKSYQDGHGVEVQLLGHREELERSLRVLQQAAPLYRPLEGVTSTHVVSKGP